MITVGGLEMPPDLLVDPECRCRLGVRPWPGSSRSLNRIARWVDVARPSNSRISSMSCRQSTAGRAGGARYGPRQPVALDAARAAPPLGECRVGITRVLRALASGVRSPSDQCSAAASSLGSENTYPSPRTVRRNFGFAGVFLDLLAAAA